MRVLLRQDSPLLGLSAGDQIAEVNLSPGVSLNFIIDAVRQGIAYEVQDQETKTSKRGRKKRAKPDVVSNGQHRGDSAR